MTIEKQMAWQAFADVIRNCLGNRKSTNYKSIFRTLIDNYKAPGASIKIKMHYLTNHVDRSPEILGAVSDDLNKRFQHDIKYTESRHQGRWNRSMVADNG